METIYCAIDNCVTEATDFVLHPTGHKTPLCYTCRCAYEWGMAHHDSIFYDVLDWDEFPKQVEEE